MARGHGVHLTSWLTFRRIGFPGALRVVLGVGVLVVQLLLRAPELARRDGTASAGGRRQ